MLFAGERGGGRNATAANPNISHVRDVHLQGILGCSRSRLLQSLDNAANERLGLARRVKILENFKKKVFWTNRHLTDRNEIVNNKLFSLSIKGLSKIFMKYSGQVFEMTRHGDTRVKRRSTPREHFHMYLNKNTPTN